MSTPIADSDAPNSDLDPVKPVRPASTNLVTWRVEAPPPAEAGPAPVAWILF